MHHSYKYLTIFQFIRYTNNGDKNMKKTKSIDKIYLKLADSSLAYSEFSTEENPSLNPEFADLIANLSDDDSTKNDVEVNIHLETPATMESKQHLASTIKKHFKHQLNDINNEKNRLWITTILLIIASVISIVVYHFLAPTIESFLFELILEIGAWVFVWECLYALFFEIPKVQFKSHLTKRIIKADIKFIEKQIN